LPPRRECRAQWHDRVFAAMPQVDLLLVIGQYAQAYHMADRRGANLTQTVAAWRAHLAPNEAVRIVLPLPHPSWRNNGWLRRNPWFEQEFLPVLRKMISQRLV
ncbi:MAG: uracil-DNA glycosylase family protein, partial [Ahrensia sp.]